MRRVSLKNKHQSVKSRRGRMSIARRPWIIVVLLILILITISVTYFTLFHSGSDGSINTSDDSSGIIPSSTSPKGESASSRGQSTEELPPSKAIQYEEGDEDLSDTLTGSITYSGVDSDIFRIRTTINQEVSGTCDLTMTSASGEVYTENTSIINSASTSSCYGYDIPLSSLGSGKWSIDILVSTNGQTGHITGEAEL